MTDKQTSLNEQMREIMEQMIGLPDRLSPLFGPFETAKDAWFAARDYGEQLDLVAGVAFDRDVNGEWWSQLLPATEDAHPAQEASE